MGKGRIKVQAVWSIVTVVLVGGAAGATRPLVNHFWAIRVSRNDEEIRRRSPPPRRTGLRDMRILREREQWEPRHLFEGQPAIRACELITNRDYEGLRRSLGTTIDPNLSGKAGASLLHWAFIADNLEAFELLLTSGADPDRKLTQGVILRNKAPLFKGDSILFTSLRSKQERKWEFFLAALRHTKDVKQRDAAEQTLLLVCTHPFINFSFPEQTLQELIDAGVELDAQDEHGNTAAMNMLAWDLLGHSLLLLKAGTNPDIRSRHGEDFAGMLARKIADYRQSGAQAHLKNALPLERWLESRRLQPVEQQ